MTNLLQLLADSTRSMRLRLGLTRRTHSNGPEDTDDDGHIGWQELRLWLGDVSRPWRHRLGLARRGHHLLLGGEDDSPLGLDHRIFIRHLEGEHRLTAWQTFSHRFWDSKGRAASADHLAFLFRRGFFPDRWWTYALEGNKPDQYLSDLQGLLLYKTNGIYAPVLNNRLLLRRVMAHYCRVPEVWYLLDQQGKGMEMSPEWKQLTLADKASGAVSMLVQPVDATSQGRSGIFRISSGQFEGCGQRGSLQQLLAMVRTWSLSAGSPYLFSELIEQNDFASGLFPDATNQLHVTLLRNPDTWEPTVAAAILRIGTSHSAPQDDFETGGISAWVDLKTGSITRALVRRQDASPRSIDTHPDTGRQVVGVQVPGWPGIMKGLHDMFEQSSYLRACSFDFMLCDDGLALVDASPLPDLGAIQAHRPLAAAFSHFRL